MDNDPVTVWIRNLSTGSGEEACNIFGSSILRG